MIIQKLIPIGTKRRSGQAILGVKFIVEHDTGNLNSTALQNVNYYINSANEIEASAHTFIDDQHIIECIPLDEKAYHVRRKVSDAIDYAIGVELCYSNGKFDNLKAYKNYVEYISSLCKQFNLQADRGLVGHYKLDPVRRTDPLNAFKLINKTWGQFIEDVKNDVKLEEKLPETCEV